MTREVNRPYDCLVIGGGPAGCTTAALVAEAGFETLLVERDEVPRFHVGESLMPETYWTLKRLGVIDTLERSAFSRKIGVQFVDETGKQSEPFFFRQHDDRASSETWHVERAHFDKLLFDNAAEKGANCLDRTRVVELDLRAESPHRAVLRDATGSTRSIEAKVVVDATGQHSMIANQLRLRVMNPQLRKAAIWGHFQIPARKESAGAVTTILHTEGKQAWFWHIPVAPDRVSIGLVSDNDFLFKDRSSPECVFKEELLRCPGLTDRLQCGERQGKLHISKEFSYTTKQHAGNGWVLVGDAFGFIDPIYSTGVFLALRSGELAADCIMIGLSSGDVSATQLGKWTADFKRGVQLFRKLVDAFYTNEFSFARFLMEHPEHHSNLTDLLIGRAFHPEAGRIFDDLDPALEAARSAVMS
jgi:flavin-dependent dehydrogenase